MWRDRTNLFISYRQSYSHHPAKKPKYGGPSSNGFRGGSEETQGLISSGAYEDDGDAIIEMDVLPPRWLDIQDEITEHLTKITQQTRKLEQLHQKHVLPGFDDEHVKQREEREIEQMTQEITRGFQACQRAIKRIETMVRDSKQQGSISKSEETMARNLKISLATRVGDASANFRKKQSTYLKKMRALGGLASPLPGSRSATPLNVQNPYTDPSLMESETDRNFSQATVLQTLQHRQTLRRENPNEAMIVQREREIEAIAQGIIDLANIFQELQTMVIDQGSMLDRIDYNVESMKENVKGAEKELVAASGYQRRTIKRKIILFLLLLVLGMIIILSLKLGLRGGDSSPPSQDVPPLAKGDNPPPPLRRIDARLLDRIGKRKARKDWRRRKRRPWDTIHIDDPS
ncbi:t-SNARE [Patellaria atrata CBS 101060]|uniref:t-SNARE n=1 Tax=Patellaria atrata CBS 101060 TaxID=1346257 RepID=A0A9P4S682_9PEZI|nr:t-SNARE [Patellaria atrata CBS 101060]